MEGNRSKIVCVHQSAPNVDHLIDKFKAVIFTESISLETIYLKHAIYAETSVKLQFYLTCNISAINVCLHYKIGQYVQLLPTAVSTMIIADTIMTSQRFSGSVQ